jgi:hypothetical protein
MAYCPVHGAENFPDCDECNEDPKERAAREEKERVGRDLSFQSATIDIPVPPAENEGGNITEFAAVGVATAAPELPVVDIGDPHPDQGARKQPAAKARPKRVRSSRAKKAPVSAAPERPGTRGIPSLIKPVVETGEPD